jgi:uncharacterized protein DUF4395
MAEACPISFERINERVARVNGALTVLSMIVFLFTPFKLIALILGADLFIRGFLKSSNSFYSLLSRNILQTFKVKPVMTNAGPKIFAAKVGFIFCGIISLFHFLNMPAVCFIFGAVLLFFAFLEAAFSFCVACRMYPYMPKFVK